VGDDRGHSHTSVCWVLISLWHRLEGNAGFLASPAVVGWFFAFFIAVAHLLQPPGPSQQLSGSANPFPACTRVWDHSVTGAELGTFPFLMS